MKHTVKEIGLGGRNVTLYTDDVPQYILVQPVDSHDMEEMTSEIVYIEQHSDKSFMLAAVKISKWNDELTPWQAPPVFGKIPFGDCAAQTLKFITDTLLPAITTDGKGQNVILGGYSLAGLFSLWSAWQTDVFEAVVAASPSVWYKDWLDYSSAHNSKVKHVYLSLGDHEYHSKNALMATVGEAIEKQKSILDAQGIENTLVWNPGNHFMDNGVRTAKGFVWAMKKLYLHNQK